MRKNGYEDFLGSRYHERMRKLLKADETFLPDSVIDAPLNIETMRTIVQGQFASDHIDIARSVTTKEQSELLVETGFYFLAMVLCPALKSRCKTSGFEEYRGVNWNARAKHNQEKALRRYHRLRTLVIQAAHQNGTPLIYN